MTARLDHAIATVRGLPAVVQGDLAAVLLLLAGVAEGGVLPLSAEDRAALEAADRETARGDFATGAEMDEFWTKPIP